MATTQEKASADEAFITLNGITLTKNAAKRITSLSDAEEDDGAMLRITVEGGGCSGFQYRYEFPVFEINEKADSGDLVFKDSSDRALMLIDPISAGFMKDSTVDFVETLGSSIFEIRNPNTTARCGCGNSFNV